jgi:methyltransferase
VTFVVISAIVVFVPMLVESRRASANERAQRRRGGIEATGDVYNLMRVAYPGAFLAMIVEGFVRNGPPVYVFASGIAVFVLAKALKWWAIAALGRSWTFRVIVVPGDPLVARGPYRHLRHPNYVAVAGELVGVALMTGAPIAGTLGTAGFALLLRRRIVVEERMLRRVQGPSLPGPSSLAPPVSDL